MPPAGMPGQGGGGAIIVPPFSYSTTFPNTETPILESGRWTNSGLGQTNVVSAAGLAYGTSSAAGGGSTADSAAILSTPVPANVSVTTILHKGTSLASFQEVEILLRASAGATALQGYEVFLEQGGMYLACVRRNGSNGGVAGVDYTFLVNGPTVATPNDGDEFKAMIVGNTIKAYLAGSLIWTHDIGLDSTGATIATIDSGSIGIGFDGPGGGGYTDSKWGFSRFSAVGL